MYHLTIVKSRKFNKILCFICLIPAVIFLMCAGIFAACGKEPLAKTFLILGAVTGAFALLYGVLWMIFAFLEGKRQRLLEEITASESEQAGTDFTCKEYLLPKEKLMQAARKRFQSIVIWSCVIAFLALAGILLLLFFSKALKEPVQILYTLIFGVVIMLPGILIQLEILNRYASSVPGKVVLFPGKMVVDQTVYAASSIKNIRITSSEVLNPNSPAVYREMCINYGEGSSCIYRIDYRTRGNPQEQPEWADYSGFVSDLYAWGNENRVDVTIDYMD